jgi:hypothetical protein
MLRLLKISDHSVHVLDLPSEGGEGVERDPWDPFDSWPANMTWTGANRMRIEIGPYRLDAQSDDASVFLYRGREDGPDGTHDFELIGVVTEERELIESPVRQMVMLDSPPFEWDPPASPKGPPVRRRVGFGNAFLGTLPAGAGTGTGSVNEPMTFRRVGGGPGRSLTLGTFPVTERPKVQLRYSNEPDGRGSGTLVINPSHVYFGGETQWYRVRAAVERAAR